MSPGTDATPDQTPDPAPGTEPGEDTAGGADVGTANLSVPARPDGLEDAPLTLEQIERRIQERFSDVAFNLQYGELTVFVSPDDLLDVLAFCRDDEELRCDLLADLSGVHWPAGEHVIERQTSTTGWPEFRVSRDRGVIEVLYILRSTYRNHWLRLSVGVDDEAPVLPSATGLWETANFHEREVYDFFGVEFEGHPNLVRILMPDGWVGHPHRKDYPLGGVDIPYKHDKFIPSPERRELREVVE